MITKSSRARIRLIVVGGFLFTGFSIGSYGQDSSGVQKPSDAKDAAVQPASATATTAVGRGTLSSHKGIDVKAPEQDEYVTVSYTKLKKDDITGSIASDPSSNVLKALQGRAAGVNVMRTRGCVETPMTVRIRGMGSMGNNDPLYVVDGVQVRSLDFLNPNDVESVSILKNPSETAIYGSRGANGIVLVTTKTAK
jgi:TonB-dependent SusC/RagA subfamily outer membrane receptor